VNEIKGCAGRIACILRKNTLPDFLLIYLLIGIHGGENIGLPFILTSTMAHKVKSSYGRICASTQLGFNSRSLLAS
jgi:hypothetical protein